MIFDWINQNRDWFFSGIGVTLLTFSAYIFRFFIRRKQPQGNTQSTSQIANDNIVNIQGGGDLAIGSVTIQHNKVPPALAKPDFSIKQIGFAGVYGREPEYTLQIYNGGGTLFSAKVKSDRSTKEYSFFQISRGQSKSIKISLSGDSDALTVIIAGIDANGVEFKKAFFGTRYTSGYEFS
ncbi:hypothetical protein HaloA020_25960 [Halomonas sp. A020]|uniref:hypothetical protein n=1 Tax=Halomonas sp. A020 TaxID=2717374 RepID=UPI00249252EF|nr:hypothetical protein [Halomonas sp. A020]BCB61895.1 hypothetical protein HaloA020_25960 [Halomonas sp. A020]